MPDFGQVLAETFLIFLEVQGLRIAGERSRGLDEHKLVHNVAEFLEAQLQHLELIHEEKAIVDHVRTESRTNGYVLRHGRPRSWGEARARRSPIPDSFDVYTFVGIRLFFRQGTIKVANVLL